MHACGCAPDLSQPRRRAPCARMSTGVTAGSAVVWLPFRQRRRLHACPSRSATLPASTPIPSGGARHGGISGSEVAGPRGRHCLNDAG